MLGVFLLEAKSDYPGVAQRIFSVVVVTLFAFAWQLRRQWTHELAAGLEVGLAYREVLWPPSRQSAPLLSILISCFALFVKRTFFTTGRTEESIRVREVKRRLLLAQMAQALRWNVSDEDEEEKEEEEKNKGDKKKKCPPPAADLFEMVYDDVEERHVTEYNIKADGEPYVSTLALFKERLMADFQGYVKFTILARREAAGENITLADTGLDTDELKQLPEFADGTKLTELLELWHKKIKRAFGKDVLPSNLLKEAEKCKRELIKEQRKGMRMLLPVLAPVLPMYFFAVGLMAFDASNGTVVFHSMKTLLDKVGAGEVTVEELRSTTLQTYIKFIFCVFAHLSAWAFCHKVTADFRLQVRNQIMANMVRQDMKFFDFYPSGILQERLNSDAEQLSSRMFHLPLRLVDSFFRLVSCIVVLYSLEPQLFYVVCVPVPVVAISSNYIIRFMRTMGQRQRKIGEHLAANTMEVLKEIRTVRDFTMENEEAEKFAASSAYRAEIEQYASGMHHIILIAPLCCMFEGMRFCCTYLGGTFVASGQLTPGQAVMAAGLAGDMTHIIRSFFDIIPEIVNTFQPLGRVCEMLSVTPSIEPHPGSQPKLKPDNFKGAIQFENVNFTFPAEPLKQVLFGLSWSIKSGETIGFVGGTGCGKSTSLYLLQRWYNPQSGKILLDGRPIVDYDVYHLRRHMAVVAQTTCLFSTTIRENIIYGLPRKAREAITDSMIEDALKKANAWKFVNEFPRKLETYAGERGVKLSGGQRQRLAIARAIVRSPTLVLLDEATSALDSKAEVVVQKALDQMLSEREGGSTIIVAHRLSTLRTCNRIIVMDKGSIKESGCHKELMNIEVTKNTDGSMITGWYRDLYETQHGKKDDSAEVEKLKSELAHLSQELEDLRDERQQDRRDAIRRLKVGLGRASGSRQPPQQSGGLPQLDLVRQSSESGTGSCSTTYPPLPFLELYKSQSAS